MKPTESTVCATVEAAATPRPPLRPATTTDVDVIARVWHRGWFDGHLGHVPDGLSAFRTFTEFRRRAAARVLATTVGVIGDRVVGFVIVTGDEVEQIYVAGPARGTGLADDLLAHAEAVIADGHETAWLAVVAGNRRARRFYERNGWVDGGGIEYPAEVTDGNFLVPSRRYEKNVSPPSTNAQARTSPSGPTPFEASFENGHPQTLSSQIMAE